MKNNDDGAAANFLRCAKPRQPLRHGRPGHRFDIWRHAARQFRTRRLHRLLCVRAALPVDRCDGHSVCGPVADLSAHPAHHSDRGRRFGALGNRCFPALPQRQSRDDDDYFLRVGFCHPLRIVDVVFQSAEVDRPVAEPKPASRCAWGAYSAP